MDPSFLDINFQTSDDCGPYLVPATNVRLTFGMTALSDIENKKEGYGSGESRRARASSSRSNEPSYSKDHTHTHTHTNLHPIDCALRCRRSEVQAVVEALGTASQVSIAELARFGLIGSRHWIPKTQRRKYPRLLLF